jgi:hypothetical protein
LVRLCRSCCRAQRKHALRIAVPECDHLMGVRMTVLLEMFFRAWFWRWMVGCLYMICCGKLKWWRLLRGVVC